MGYEDALLNAGYVPTGQTPKRIDANGNVTSAAPGSQGLAVLNQALAGMFQNMQAQQEKKQKELKDQFDMYKTLRDAGYDSQSAHAAVQKRAFPNTPGGVTPEEEKQKADLAKTQAETAKLNRQAAGIVDPLEQAKIDYYKNKAGQSDNLTPGQRLQKDKMTTQIFSTVESNKVKRAALDAAEKSLPNVPQGLVGKAKLAYMRNADPNNPMLADWQNLKSVLTDAQLMNTAKTKGAISDREMELFAKAAANDDLVSVARATPVLKRLKAFMDAEEAGIMKSYQKNYGEDPKSWFEEGGQRAPEQKKGYTKGQIIESGGKKYRIIGGDPNDPDVEEVV